VLVGPVARLLEGLAGVSGGRGAGELEGVDSGDSASGSVVYHRTAGIMLVGPCRISNDHLDPPSTPP